MKSDASVRTILFLFFRLLFRKNLVLTFTICILAVSSCLYAAEQPEEAPAYRVLVLYSFGYHIPAQQQITDGFIAEMARQQMSLESTYFEYLDITPPRTPMQKENLSELLLNKYAGVKFSLIITIFDAAYEFLMNQGVAISPGSPVVSFGFKKALQQTTPIRPVHFVEYDYDFLGTFELAVSLFPKTQHVVFLAGAPSSNKMMELRAKKEFAPFEDKYTFEYTSHLSVEEIVQRLKTLPENSICIYTIISSDITGRVFVPNELLKTFSEVANAPFFSVITPHLGSGIVGGMMFDMKEAGAMLARTAIAAFNGKEQAIEPTSNLIKPMFDWKQIERWHRDVSLLPSSSIFINRPQTLWSQYREFVLGTTSVILLLSLLVAALVFQIRKRILTEKKLRQSERHFRTIFDASSETMIIHELPTGRIIDVNNTASEMLGYSRQEALALSMEELSSGIHPYTGTEVAKLIQDVSANKPHMIEWQLRHKSGNIIWVEVQLKHVSLGGQTRVLATIRDITERKKLEEQLIQSQKMESVGRLAGGVAHDFNNMLSVILGFAELSQCRLSDTDALAKNLEQIIIAAEKSRDITRQLLAFSRKDIVSPKVININRYIVESQKNLGRLVGEDVHFSLKLEETLWRVLIDPSQLDQILMNLLVNARDAMPDGGDLILQTSNIDLPEEYCAIHLDARPGEHVQLTVSDSGQGMSKDVVAHIFEPFYTTKESGKGTGLGLATVYGIVKQNRGFINVYSEPGNGTTFNIFLPRELATESDINEVSDSVKLGCDEGTILLVEDDENVREMATQMLERLGYTVRSARSPLEAIDLCSQQGFSFDLLMTDVVMPEMNGKTLAEKLRPVIPDRRVLFMSGYTEDLIAQRGIVEEGISFIRKPFGMNTLQKKVREALNR